MQRARCQALSDEGGSTVPRQPLGSPDRRNAVNTSILRYDCPSLDGRRASYSTRRPAPGRRRQVSVQETCLRPLPERRGRCDDGLMTGLSLALANLKPGTGKTTSAVWLAHIFAEAGNNVLLVDADPSGSALEWSDISAMYPRLTPPEAAFPFRIVALPSRELHRRVPAIAQAYDVVIIDAPQLEDHAGIARSALRYADEILIPCAPTPIEINRTTPVRDEIADIET